MISSATQSVKEGKLGGRPRLPRQRVTQKRTVAVIGLGYVGLPLASLAVVVDGRNALDKKALVQAGVVYRGIGR